MSRIGIAVVAKNLDDIASAAAAARAKLTVPAGRLVVRMDWLLERRVCPIMGVELDIREDSDSEMRGAHASFDIESRVLKVRESVMRGCTLECPEAVFTLGHEIGHICLHSDKTYFRRHEPEKLPKKNSDPEWQADMFAVEFLIDRTQLEHATDQLAAIMRSGVPKQQAVTYLAEYRARRVKALKEHRLDQYLREMTQDGFDF